MNLSGPTPPPTESETRWAGWDAKEPETLRHKKPIYRRQWFRLALLIALAAALFAGLVGAVLLRRWHREQLADLARQQRGVEAFVHSTQFAGFARATDAQLLALLNFIAVRPVETRRLLPAVVAWEDAHHAMPWTLSVSPQPVSTFADPARVLRSGRALAVLLEQRGFVFDAARRTEARRLFLRLLAPPAQTYVETAPENAFPALFLDRRLQDLALAAYAARSGSDASVADVEQLFALYAALGPALWRAIEEDQSARTDRGR